MNQLPAHLQNRQRRDVVGAALGGLNTGSPPHISIAGNRFTLVDDAGNEKPIQTLYLDVCVIDGNPAVSKIYFDPTKPFVAGGDNSNPPICWSDNGIGASAQASQPQNTSCQLCPMNAWGSKISAQNTKVKLCTDVKKVAVVVPGMDMVFLFRIPPASLKNWGKYCQTLAGHGVDLPDAFTRLEFESQGILKFSPAVQANNSAYVDDRTAAFSDKVMEAKGTDLLVGRNDRPWGGAADAAKVAYAGAQREALPPPPSFAQSAQAAPPAAPAPAFMPPPQPFGGGAAPAQQQAEQGHPFAQPAPSSPFGQPSTSSPTDATPPRTRKPRAPKTGGEGQPAAAADDGIPPFLQRNTGMSQNEAPPPAPNPTQFGMQAAPAAPDAGMLAALDAAFRLPTA